MCCVVSIRRRRRRLHLEDANTTTRRHSRTTGELNLLRQSKKYVRRFGGRRVLLGTKRQTGMVVGIGTRTDLARESSKLEGKRL